MKPGRPLEFDPDAALDSAMHLFWSRGYSATSLQDLLAGMGIARSSFYQAFHSKEEVFLRSVDRYRDWLVGRLRERLDSSESAMDFLRDTLDLVAEDADEQDPPIGCLVFNSAAEFGQTHRRIARRVAASIDAFTRVFVDAVRRAQQEGDIEPDADPVVLARHLVCTMSGLQTLAKAGASRAELLVLAEKTISGLG